jgi:hypothetical protein
VLRWSRRAAFLLFPACFNPHYDHPACGSHDECPSGFSCSAARVCEKGPLDGDAPICFGRNIRICFSGTVPAVPRTLGTTEIDTDLMASGSLCDQNNDQKARYCVVVGAPLMLSAGAMLTARGDKPLVLLSTTTMDLLGDIDVSSHRNGRRGPGANPAGACSFKTAPTEATMGGGGYGASLSTVGGSGGNAGTQATGGGVAGTQLDRFPMALRGGCKGGDGSLLSTQDLPGVGGDGGGAIAVVAVRQIHVDATINASGGGGRSGAMNASNGGGGGGTGGMIVFDSPMALGFGARTKLWANGGGGAQGGSGATGADGNESAGPTQAASGGSGGGTGGAGGSGSLGSGTGAGGTSTTLGGGGGGGGGAGFIHAPGFTDLSSISPPSSDPPSAP